MNHGGELGHRTLTNLSQGEIVDVIESEGRRSSEL